MADTADQTVTELAPRIDIVILSGREFELTVPVLQGDGSPVSAAAIGHARAQVRPQIDSAQVLFEFSTDEDPANLVIDGTTAALLVLTASPAVTTDWQAAWPGGRGQAVVWWDLEFTDTDEVTHQITRPGTVTLVHQVTR